MDPAPLQEDLSAAYVEYYTHGDPPLIGIKGLLKRSYEFALTLPYWLFGIAQERERSSLMFLNQDPPGSVLDVGCGSGEFLAQMRARGWRVHGLDFDPKAAEVAMERHGIEVQLGTVESLIQSGVKYDVITASHVIEHIADPVSFLQSCGALLAPSGKLVLKTPNVDSFGHRVFGSSWRGLEPPRHLQLFSSEALAMVSKRAGFNSATFTSSAGAEYILAASHFLRAHGEFRSGSRAFGDMLTGKLIGTWWAMRARLAWLADRRSGEELCSVLTKA